ncbi:hypothetical protein TUMEXPCC7403_21220 [Tumidithrix helvetica PCC 7403]|uniref:membrane protein insertion efficiency factor YidD n=1 Tax=Tumidithrix helvetica TaxID=3457545 RepID=UPI003CBEC3CE
MLRKITAKQSFDRVLRDVAIASISGYQRYLSPYKGFSCAHRVLHGSESCSAYTKRQIAEKGLLQGLNLSRSRFYACKQASEILNAPRSEIYLATKRTPPKDPYPPKRNVPSKAYSRTSKQNSPNQPKQKNANQCIADECSTLTVDFCCGSDRRTGLPNVCSFF